MLLQHHHQHLLQQPLLCSHLPQCATQPQQQQPLPLPPLLLPPPALQVLLPLLRCSRDPAYPAALLTLLLL
jgi:hypothetical protein